MEIETVTHFNQIYMPIHLLVNLKKNKIKYCLQPNVSTRLKLIYIYILIYSQIYPFTSFVDLRKFLILGLCLS